MVWRWQVGRTLGVALGATVFLAFGCATTPPSSTVSAPRPTTVPVENLTPAEEQQAEAMAHYAAGVSLELQGGPGVGLAEYQRSFELDPHNTPLAVRLAQYYLSQKQPTNAVAVLESASQAEPDSAEPWFWLGLAYRTSDQPTQAIAALQQALKLDPAHLNARQTLLEIYVQDNNVAAVTQQLDQARRQNSYDWRYWLRLGDIQSLLLKQKPTLVDRISEAQIRAAYEKAKTLAPEEPDVLLRLAEIYARSNEDANALETYATLLKLRPDLPQVRERLAQAYIRSGQKEKAAAVLEDILKRDPLRHEIYNILGGLYEELEKDEDAITNYEQSLVANPNQLEPALRIALLQMKLKRYDRAQQTLATAKERYPTAFQIPYFTGLICSDEKHYDKALAAFGDAVALAETAPEPVKLDATFYFYYGAAAERAGDFEKAATLFKKSLDLDPERHATYNYLGYMWADQGVHLGEALELIQKAVKLDPNNAAYLDSLGWVLFKLGRAEEALPHLRQAVMLMKQEKDLEHQEDSTLLDHLAEVLLKLGKRDEAIHVWERALKVEPDNKAIAAKLQHLTGNPKP